MKILHILDHSAPLHSGYTFRTLAILREQRALGWETCHITGPKHKVSQALEEDVDGYRFFRTSPLGPISSRLPVVDQLAVIEKLTRRLHEVTVRVQPDILHAHSPVLNGIAALRVGKRLGLPVVYEVRAFWEDAAADHGTTREDSIRYRLTRRLETSVLRRAQAVAVICEGLKSDIIARGLNPHKVTVIPNAVDIDRFRIGGMPDQTLVGRYDLKNRKVLGFVGSFYAYEGLALLLRALPSILAREPNVRLMLVGGGPQERELRRIAEEKQLLDKVHFVGRVSHEEVGLYYDLMDIMVYPRMPMRLTERVTPLKPLEAMAQGKLVIASDVGGHRELLRDGETGYLFSAGHAEALAQTVVDAVRGCSRWPTIRSMAREFVENERTWRKSVACYQELYGRLTSPKAVPEESGSGNHPARSHAEK